MRNQSSALWQYVLVAVLVCAGVYFIKPYFTQSYQAVQLSDQAKLREYVSHKIPAKQAGSIQKFLTAQADGQAEPDDCRAQRDRILTANFDDLVKDIEGRRVLFNPACQVYDSKLASSSYADMIYRNCKSPDIDDSAKKNACMTGLFFYKSAIVASATKNEPVENMDVQTLSHNLFSMLGLGEMKTPESVSRLEALTSRLTDLLPNSPGAYKAALIPRLLQEVQNSNPENTERLTQALDKARELNPNDPQIEDINLFLLTREGRSVSLEKAEGVVAANPESSAARLFLAKVYARHKNYEQSSAMLSELSQKFPDDARIKEAYDQLNAKDYEKLSQFQIGLGSDDF